jgi:hypothetical protein
MLLQIVLFETSPLSMLQFKAVARRGTAVGITNPGKIYSHQMYSISKAADLSHSLLVFSLSPRPARLIGYLIYPLFVLSGAELPPHLISHNITHRRGRDCKTAQMLIKISL